MALTMLLGACKHDRAWEPEDYQEATQVVLDWNKLVLDLERYTSGYRPPVSARLYAYMGIAAYEAAIPALPDNISLKQYFPEYRQPDPSIVAGRYCLPAGLNAAYAAILREFFPTAPNFMLDRITRLESKHAQFCKENNGEEILRRSAQYGQRVARAVWEWSSTDSLGHDGFLYNFDRNYISPTGTGMWRSTGEHEMPPLLPHWGGVRHFIVQPGEITAKAPVPFDESPNSAFYADAMEVFSASQTQSKESRWIAEFWSDDLSGLTMTPAGRWISIINQLVDKNRPTFPQVIEVYLKSGLALGDVAILVWDIKYRYHLERPETYIARNIQPGWKPLHDTPSFPSYPSGHAAFGATVAEILTQQFGNDFDFTDRTHEDRREFEGAPRRFHSFHEMARENAFSRVLMGVHYRMDCEEGLRLGKIVGQKVGVLSLKREAAAMR